jgi:hypothetical protein
VPYESRALALRTTLAIAQGDKPLASASLTALSRSLDATAKLCDGRLANETSR